MPERPSPLLGCNILCKLDAQVTFSDKSIQLHVPEDAAWKAQLFLLTDKNSEVPRDSSIPEDIWMR